MTDMSEFQSYVTAAGLNMLSRFASGGEPIELTEFSLGSGEAAHSTNSESLEREEYRAAVDVVTRPFDDKAVVQVTAVAPADVGPFWVREVGVYTSTGVLFAVANVPPTFKVEGDGGVTKDLFWRLSLRVVNEDAVALASDPNVALVSRSELEASEARASDVSADAVVIFHHHTLGDDSRSGRTPGTAVKTWSRIVDLLKPGRRCVVYLLNVLDVDTLETITAPPATVEFRSHDGTGPSASRRNISFLDADNSDDRASGLQVYGSLNLVFRDVRLAPQWVRSASPITVEHGTLNVDMEDSQFLVRADNPDDRAIFAMPMGGHLRFVNIGAALPVNVRGRVVEGVAADADPNDVPGLSSNLNSL